MNTQPIIDLDNFGKIKFSTHRQLEFLESSTFSPVKFFIEPIGVSLNYLDEYFDFDSNPTADTQDEETIEFMTKIQMNFLCYKHDVFVLV